MTATLRNLKYLDMGEVCARYNVNRSTLWRWFKKHEDFPDPVIINNRRYFSEIDLMRWEAARGGVDPDTQGKLIGLQPVSGVITDYEELVAALKKRRETIGLTVMELDAKSGMQEGYASKLENYGRPQGRGMGPEVFPLWLGGLKVGIILVDLPRRPRKGKQA